MAIATIWNVVAKNIVVSNGENNMSLLGQSTLKLKMGVKK
jgi:hypothetical protein